eukprot:1092393-Rhodomonas_salina.6
MSGTDAAYDATRSSGVPPLGSRSSSWDSTCRCPVLTTRCPVLTYDVLPPRSYAMSGTDVAYATTRSTVLNCGTDVAYAMHARCALCGTALAYGDTEIAYGATRPLGEVRRKHSPSSPQRGAMRRRREEERGEEEEEEGGREKGTHAHTACMWQPHCCKGRERARARRRGRCSPSVSFSRSPLREIKCKDTHVWYRLYWALVFLPLISPCSSLER